MEFVNFVGSNIEGLWKSREARRGEMARQLVILDIRTDDAGVETMGRCEWIASVTLAGRVKDRKSVGYLEVSSDDAGIETMVSCEWIASVRLARWVSHRKVAVASHMVMIGVQLSKHKSNLALSRDFEI